MLLKGTRRTSSGKLQLLQTGVVLASLYSEYWKYARCASIYLSLSVGVNLLQSVSNTLARVSPL